MMNRRTRSLEALPPTVTAATLLTGRIELGCGGPRDSMKLACSSTTVRDQMKAVSDGTLAKVAARSATRRSNSLDILIARPKRCELPSTAMMVSLPPPVTLIGDVLGDRWLAQIESAKIIGQSYIVCPWIPEEICATKPDGWQARRGNFQPLPARLARRLAFSSPITITGSSFLPVNDRTCLTIFLLENCDSDLVKMELDSVLDRGSVAVIRSSILTAIPGGSRSSHVKDMKKLPKISRRR